MWCVCVTGSLLLPASACLALAGPALPAPLVAGWLALARARVCGGRVVGERSRVVAVWAGCCRWPLAWLLLVAALACGLAVAGGLSCGVGASWRRAAGLWKLLHWYIEVKNIHNS